MKSWGWWSCRILEVFFWFFMVIFLFLSLSCFFYCPVSSCCEIFFFFALVGWISWKIQEGKREWDLWLDDHQVDLLRFSVLSVNKVVIFLFLWFSCFFYCLARNLFLEGVELLKFLFLLLCFFSLLLVHKTYLKW